MESKKKLIISGEKTVETHTEKHHHFLRDDSNTTTTTDYKNSQIFSANSDVSLHSDTGMLLDGTDIAGVNIILDAKADINLNPLTGTDSISKNHTNFLGLHHDKYQQTNETASPNHLAAEKKLIFMTPGDVHNVGSELSAKEGIEFVLSKDSDCSNSAIILNSHTTESHAGLSFHSFAGMKLPLSADQYVAQLPLVQDSQQLAQATTLDDKLSAILHLSIDAVNTADNGLSATRKGGILAGLQQLLLPNLNLTWRFGKSTVSKDFQRVGPGSIITKHLSIFATEASFYNNVGISAESSDFNVDKISSTGAYLHNSVIAEDNFALFSLSPFAILHPSLNNIGFTHSYNKNIYDVWQGDAMHLGDLTLQANQAVFDGTQWHVKTLTGDVNKLIADAEANYVMQVSNYASLFSSGSFSVGASERCSNSAAITTPFAGENSEFYSANDFSVGTFVSHGEKITNIHVDHSEYVPIDEFKKEHSFNINGSGQDLMPGSHGSSQVLSTWDFRFTQHDYRARRDQDLTVLHDDNSHISFAAPVYHPMAGKVFVDNLNWLMGHTHPAEINMGSRVHETKTAVTQAKMQKENHSVVQINPPQPQLQLAPIVKTSEPFDFIAHYEQSQNLSLFNIDFNDVSPQREVNTTSSVDDPIEIFDPLFYPVGFNTTSLTDLLPRQFSTIELEEGQTLFDLDFSDIPLARPSYDLVSDNNHSSSPWLINLNDPIEMFDPLFDPVSHRDNLQNLQPVLDIDFRGIFSSIAGIGAVTEILEYDKRSLTTIYEGYKLLIKSRGFESFLTDLQKDLIWNNEVFDKYSEDILWPYFDWLRNRGSYLQNYLRPSQNDFIPNHFSDASSMVEQTTQSFEEYTELFSKLVSPMRLLYGIPLLCDNIYQISHGQSILKTIESDEAVIGGGILGGGIIDALTASFRDNFMAPGYNDVQKATETSIEAAETFLSGDAALLKPMADIPFKLENIFPLFKAISVPWRFLPIAGMVVGGFACEELIEADNEVSMTSNFSIGRELRQAANLREILGRNFRNSIEPLYYAPKLSNNSPEVYQEYFTILKDQSSAFGKALTQHYYISGDVLNMLPLTQPLTPTVLNVPTGDFIGSFNIEDFFNHPDFIKSLSELKSGLPAGLSLNAPFEKALDDAKIAKEIPAFDIDGSHFRSLIDKTSNFSPGKIPAYKFWGASLLGLTVVDAGVQLVTSDNKLDTAGKLVSSIVAGDVGWRLGARIGLALVEPEAIFIVAGAAVLSSVASTIAAEKAWDHRHSILDMDFDSVAMASQLGDSPDEKNDSAFPWFVKTVDPLEAFDPLFDPVSHRNYLQSLQPILDIDFSDTPFFVDSFSSDSLGLNHYLNVENIERIFLPELKDFPVEKPESELISPNHFFPIHFNFGPIVEMVGHDFENLEGLNHSFQNLFKSADFKAYLGMAELNLYSKEALFDELIKTVLDPFSEALYNSGSYFYPIYQELDGQFRSEVFEQLNIFKMADQISDNINEYVENYNSLMKYLRIFYISNLLVQNAFEVAEGKAIFPLIEKDIFSTLGGISIASVFERLLPVCIEVINDVTPLSLIKPVIWSLRCSLPVFGMIAGTELGESLADNEQHVAMDISMSLAAARQFWQAGVLRDSLGAALKEGVSPNYFAETLSESVIDSYSNYIKILRDFSTPMGESLIKPLSRDLFTLSQVEDKFSQSTIFTKIYEKNIPDKYLNAYAKFIEDTRLPIYNVNGDFFREVIDKHSDFAPPYIDRLKNIGKSLFALALVQSLYELATADDKIITLGRMALSWSAAEGGSYLGALAGLEFCGPFSPLCVAGLSLAGGSVGVLLAEKPFDPMHDDDYYRISNFNAVINFFKPSERLQHQQDLTREFEFKPRSLL